MVLESGWKYITLYPSLDGAMLIPNRPSVHWNEIPDTLNSSLLKIGKKNRKIEENRGGDEIDKDKKWRKDDKKNHTNLRIGLKESMLDEPWFSRLPRVDHQSGATQITQISEGILAGVIFERDIREKRIVRFLILGDNEFS